MTAEPNVLYSGIFTWLLRPLATRLPEFPRLPPWHSQAVNPQSLMTQQRFSLLIYSNCFNAISNYDRAEDKKPSEAAWYLKREIQNQCSSKPHQCVLWAQKTISCTLCLTLTHSGTGIQQKTRGSPVLWLHIFHSSLKTSGKGFRLVSCKTFS